MAIADKTKIGIASPHIFPDGRVDMAFVGQFVRRAEALGYSSLWTQERVTGAATALHPTTFLAYLAGQTSKARLGVSVYVLPRHNPVLMAKHMADIDQMSGGRLILGVGLGSNMAELPMYGITGERRVRRFVEQVEAIRALWTNTPSGHSGEFYQIADANIEPKPLQRPHPPIWFGANVDAALRRSVRHADGWMGAGSSSLDDFPRKFALMKSLLQSTDGTPRRSPSRSASIWRWTTTSSGRCGVCGVVRLLLRERGQRGARRCVGQRVQDRRVAARMVGDGRGRVPAEPGVRYGRAR